MCAAFDRPHTFGPLRGFGFVFVFPPASPPLGQEHQRPHVEQKRHRENQQISDDVSVVLECVIVMVTVLGLPGGVVDGDHGSGQPVSYKHRH